MNLHYLLKQISKHGCLISEPRVKLYKQALLTQIQSSFKLNPQGFAHSFKTVNIKSVCGEDWNWHWVWIYFRTNSSSSPLTTSTIITLSICPQSRHQAWFHMFMRSSWCHWKMETIAGLLPQETGGCFLREKEDPWWGEQAAGGSGACAS